MAKEGAKFNKIKIHNFSEEYRGVVATKDITKGEQVMFIPKCLLLTMEKILKNPIAEALNK